MKIIVLFFVFFLAIISIVNAQEARSISDQDKPVLTGSGFVKAEALFDTRQVVEAREGYLLLYPKKAELDKAGKDINAHGSFNQYAMFSRLAVRLTGAEAMGAKVVAHIEGDFTGASNAENNSLRLRHAYVKLSWPSVSVLAGQYWHPLDIPEMIPNVLALNTGAPFHPFSRQPQVRVDVKKGKLNGVFAFASQRDFTNTGPAGSGSIYVRNSILPNLHAQLQFAGSTLFAGIGADFKQLTPRLVTDSLYKTKEHINCYSVTAFAKATFNMLTIKTQALYGQGLNDHLMMGGYGVTDINPTTNHMEYTPLNYLSAWLTINTNGKKWQGSLFLGYTKGYGAEDDIVGPVYARDPEIAYIWRFAPLITYFAGKFSVASEFELTTASYGNKDSKYKITTTGISPVTNARFSLSATYSF